MPFGVATNLLGVIVPSLIQDLFLSTYRILYTADTENVTDDKAIIVNGVNGVYNKRPVIYRANGHFDNVNFIADRKSVECDDDDEDDERSPVIAVQNGDIV